MSANRESEPVIESLNRYYAMATLDAFGILIDVRELIKERAAYASLLLDPQKFDKESVQESLDDCNRKIKELLILD